MIQCHKLHAAAALCDTDTASVQPRPQPKPEITDFSQCSHTATRSPSPPFNGLHTRNPCTYVNYYSFTNPGWMVGWVGPVDSPAAKSLPTITDQAQGRKVCWPETDVLTTEPRCHCKYYSTKTGLMRCAEYSQNLIIPGWVLSRSGRASGPVSDQSPRSRSLLTGGGLDEGTAAPASAADGFSSQAGEAAAGHLIPLMSRQSSSSRDFNAVAEPVFCNEQTEWVSAFFLSHRCWARMCNWVWGVPRDWRCWHKEK